MLADRQFRQATTSRTRKVAGFGSKVVKWAAENKKGAQSAAIGLRFDECEFLTYRSK